MKLVDLSVQEFLTQLSSDQPAPGGGSAAALAGAAAAGLCAMVARLTLGKAKYEKSWEVMQTVLNRVAPLETSFLELVDADSDAYNQVVAAFKLPKAGETEKKQRQQSIQRAFTHAAEIPLKTLRHAAELLAPLQQVIEKGNPNCITDAGSAVQFCRTSALAAAYNVRINLSAIKDATMVSQLEQECTTLWRQVDGATASLEASVARILEI